MTVSRVRAPIAGLAQGERTLDRAAAHYLTRVRRLAAGDPFVAFDPTAAREADAVVLRVGETVVIRVDALRPAAVVAPRAITWIQGLPKGPKADGVIRDATELGATVIVLVETARSVVRLEARAETRLARWQKIAEEAARQCERADVPRLAVATLEEALGAVDPRAARFCLWERATIPAGPALRHALDEHEDEGGDGPARPLAFLVGPEGGLDEAEVHAAEGAGFSAVSLGALILRTETVAAAVLGAVRVLG